MLTNFTPIVSVIFINIISAVVLTSFVLLVTYWRSHTGITFQLIAFLMSFVAYAAVLSVIVTSKQIEYPTEYLPTLAVLVPISIVIIFLIGFYFYRTIVKPIQDIAEQSKRVTSGNFDIKIKKSRRKDEIGTLTNSLSEMFDFLNLKPLIEKIGESVKILTVSTEQLASTSEEINAASEEISSTVQEISKGAVKQNDLIVNSLEKARELQAQFNENSRRLYSTSELIEEFTKQINILSLNASIEAARAGEYGRGFAVVAESIQKLADETNKSLKTINDVVEQIESSLKSSFSTIIDSIQNIASVSEETASGAEEVSSSVEEQSATLQEFSSNSVTLANLAKELSGLTAGLVNPNS